MFSIAFTDEPLEYPYDDATVAAAPGMLVLGNTFEEFLANLFLWTKSDYLSHWKREVKSLVEGKAKIALVVCYNDRRFANHLEIWKAYRDGDRVHFQNQLLWYDNLPADFDISNISDHIDDRAVVDADGNHISEWTVSVRDVEEFLYRPLRLRIEKAY